MRALLLALAAFLFALPASADDAETRLMTFNIRLDLESDGANAWPHRRHAVSALIRFYEPDILGMQEVRVHQRDQLKDDLPDYAFVGVGRDDGREGGEFSSLAYRRDRFRLRESGNFWLSQTPDTPGLGWDAAYIRIVTWARLRDRETDRRILVLNTHWDNEGLVARLESARMIRAWVQQHRRFCEQVVVMGDFNAPPDEASYQALIAPGEGALVDSADLARIRFGPPGTFNGFDILHAEPAPIDHILISERATVSRSGVITQQNAGRLPSDHYPVMADVSFPRC